MLRHNVQCNGEPAAVSLARLDPSKCSWTNFFTLAVLCRKFLFFDTQLAIWWCSLLQIIYARKKKKIPGLCSCCTGYVICQLCVSKGILDELCDCSRAIVMEAHREAQRRAMGCRMLCVLARAINMWDGVREACAAYGDSCSTLLMHSNWEGWRKWDVKESWGLSLYDMKWSSEFPAENVQTVKPYWVGVH